MNENGPDKYEMRTSLLSEDIKPEYLHQIVGLEDFGPLVAEIRNGLNEAKSLTDPDGYFRFLSEIRPKMVVLRKIYNQKMAEARLMQVELSKKLVQYGDVRTQFRKRVKFSFFKSKKEKQNKNRLSGRIDVLEREYFEAFRRHQKLSLQCATLKAAVEELYPLYLIAVSKI